jgi:hypothetical protein
VVDAQLDLADDRQLVLDEQVVVAVDAAADGVLHRQDAVRGAAVRRRRRTLSRNWGRGGWWRRE